MAYGPPHVRDAPYELAAAPEKMAPDMMQTRRATSAVGYLPGALLAGLEQRSGHVDMVEQWRFAEPNARAVESGERE